MRNVPKRDQLGFQDHIRQGLKLLGLTQAELRREHATAPTRSGRQDRHQLEKWRRSDYRWVRKHLSRNDPHFTHAVARELFKMVAENPKAESFSGTRALQWALWGSDPQAAVVVQDLDQVENEGYLCAFVPAVQHRRFADEIVGVLEHADTRKSKRSFSRSRKSHMASVITSWLHQHAGRMAYHLGLFYPRRIAKTFPQINEKECHDVLMAAHDTAFIAELGLEPKKPIGAPKRGAKAHQKRNGGKPHVR